MDFEKFCSDIMALNPKVRFATIYDDWGKKLAGGIREGVENLLSPHQEKEMVSLSVMDWKARKEMSKWLGKTIYTLGEYEKIKRFSFYLGLDNLLLVSTEKDADTNEIVDGVIKLYYKNLE
ncbi:hypothetical protein NsoK4_01405 [Nitrosopumilus sp. K4]|uniref:DUF6659 family protein n=1 Tax=Nitrosopumilus sp. K4 TaxID=2795383 RepID=UPI001BADB794|nr:DUF6659 family protein [Nitrosopumilus sp. K4]QUC64965.1 hypothetical protein NsoK4_01405 [Nitrosopumilus sp. K4]